MSQINTGLYSSASDNWSTPQWLFDHLCQEFGPFALDVCATADNAKCEHYFTPEQDGLAQPWPIAGVCWMNPPYGREIGKWIHKARTSNARVVCLLPARTDTAWWHEEIMAYAGEVRLVRGRLKFGGSKNSAPFPSAIVTFQIKLALSVRLTTMDARGRG